MALVSAAVSAAVQPSSSLLPSPALAFSAVFPALRRLPVRNGCEKNRCGKSYPVRTALGRDEAETPQQETKTQRTPRQF